MRDWAVMVRERPQRPPEVVCVPYGFSWGALVFQPLWALWNAAWLTALVLLAIGVLASLLARGAGLDALGVSIVELATAIGLAFVALDLRRAELGRRRFRLVDMVRARSAAEAEGLAFAGSVDRPGDQTGERAMIPSVRGLQPPADRSM